MGPFSAWICASCDKARVSLMTNVAKSPGLTGSLRVLGFDLRAPRVALQSPVCGANCSCVKKTYYLTVLA